MRDGRTNEQTNKQTTSEYRATQLLICEKLSLAIYDVGADQGQENHGEDVHHALHLAEPGGEGHHVPGKGPHANVTMLKDVDIKDGMGS